MNTNEINLSNSGLILSKIVHGMMRLNTWNYTKKELLKLIEKDIDIGVTTFDHADIYGNYTCEKIFGEVLKDKKDLRRRIQIITKCGIVLSKKNHIKYYDTSKEHIIKSVETSLKNLNTDYIDLLLIHRPDPLMNPNKVAEAFNELKRDGKVLHFGVSNFTSQQFKMIESRLNFPLITNQIEVSPYNLSNFKNDEINFLMKKRVNPMAWSPNAGGLLFKPNDEKSKKLNNVLNEVAKELNLNSIDKVIYAWILNHPAGILPIIGSGKVERLKIAIDSLNIKLTKEQWFKIYTTSLGHNVY
ncbi:oxidoreductase [Tepiditoga spiralis]|uniref:Oxidoreductase n=1 Tax=Tepiditoga spiralis TaxID=2108365 RepID=A0A7G1GBN5_9BACT|nr:aldo/keto reductase [Tepiditoga spiralis]BBE31209.1 oxidoreductase [Tepiditoga spiralis]